MIKDCPYNITEAEIKEIILKGGISGVVCFSICLLSFLIGIVCLCRTKSNFILRLFLYYTLVCTLYTGTRSLYMIHYLTYDDYFDDPFCKTLGFLNCYVKLLMSIFLITVSVLILFKVYSCTQVLKQCASALKKRYCLFESLFILLLFVTPLLFSWTPFINDHYGREGPYCWLTNISCKSNFDVTSLTEVVLLYVVPMYTAAGFNCIGVLLVTIRLVCLLCKTGLLNDKKRIIIKEFCMLLALLVTSLSVMVGESLAYAIGATYSLSTLWTIELTLFPVVGGVVSVISAVYIVTTWYIHRHRYKYQSLPGIHVIGEPHFHQATAFGTSPPSCRVSLPTNTSQHAPNFLSPSEA